MRTAIFTQSEFTYYKMDVLSKTKGNNIHNVTGKLGAIKGFIDLIDEIPARADYYNQIIENAKGEIFQLIHH